MTIQKSEEIKNEINQITKRLDELTETQKSISNNLKIMQDSFIAGGISLDEMQIEQSKLTVLNNSVKSLQQRQTEIQTAFEEAKASEIRAEQVSKAKAIALEADKMYSEYLQCRDEINETLQLVGDKMTDSGSRFIGKQYEWLKVLAGINPRLSDAEIELPQETIDLVAGRRRHLPSLEFEETIASVEARIDRNKQQMRR